MPKQLNLPVDASAEPAKKPDNSSKTVAEPAKKTSDLNKSVSEPAKKTDNSVKPVVQPVKKTIDSNKPVVEPAKKLDNSVKPVIESTKKTTDSNKSVSEPAKKPDDSNKVSLTKELKADVKIIASALKEKNSKAAAIFSFVSAGIWLLCAIFWNVSYASVPALSIVSLIFLSCAACLLFFAWKKAMLAPENIKYKNLNSKFLLVAFLCSAVSIIVGIFNICSVYLGWISSWEIIQAFDWILSVVGIGFSIAAGILLLVSRVNGQQKNV